MTITAYMLNVEQETAAPVEIEKDLHSYYDLLGCRLIAMPTHKIGVRNGRQYTIIADDEALMKEQPKISAIDNLGNPMLCGNLLIVKVNEEGDTIGLDADDIQYIERFIQLQGTHKFPLPYPMLHQCEYAW